MADNLSFDITADSTKARADLALMESSLRKARRELKSFADEANKTGDTTKLTKVTQEIQRTEKAYASLKKEVHGTREETEGFFESISHAAHGNRGVARLIREFGTLNGSIENTSLIFGRLVGGLAGGVAVGAAIKGFEFLRDTVNEVSKNLGELRAAAGGLNLKPIELQGARRAVGAIGEEADIATKALEGMNAQMEELRKHPPGAGAVGAGSAFGVQVSRGGQPTPSDFGKPLQMLGIEAQVANLAGSRRPEAPLEAMRLQLQALVQQARNFNSTDLNIISKTLFSGVPSNSMLAVAPALLKTWGEEIERLKQSSAGATAAALKEDKELRASKDALSNSYEAAAGTIAKTLRSYQIGFNQLLSTALVRDAKQFQKDMAFIEQALVRDANQFQKDMETIAPNVKAAWRDITHPGEALGRALSGVTRSAAASQDAEAGTAVAETKKAFDTLPAFFEGLTNTIAKRWGELWKQLSAMSQQGKAKMSLETTLPGLPQVFRGGSGGGSAGSGSVYNPEGEDVGGGYRLLYGGHGPYGHRVQSFLPGVSDYQAPPHMAEVHPSQMFSGLIQSSEATAKAITDLGTAASGAAKAWVNPSIDASDPESSASSPAGQFARGGFVRGPGSGTSDSILARLSAGEFVVNSARVRQVGLGFLQRLNGFADGGFVGPAPLRFAAGGLVPSAAGGRAVHLHLGSNSFQLSGSGSVVDALVREASGAQMRSAGVKPSWFASRPSGQ